MSSNVLRLHGGDPTATVSESTGAALAALARHTFPDADRVTVASWDGIRFVDCGVNLESVACPTCGAELLHGRRWQRLVGEAMAPAEVDLAITTPCCTTETTLDRLRYHWPAAFARFSIDVWDPSTTWFVPGSEPDAAALAFLSELTQRAGCEIGTVWAHY